MPNRTKVEITKTKMEKVYESILSDKSARNEEAIAKLTAAAMKAGDPWYVE